MALLATVTDSDRCYLGADINVFVSVVQRVSRRCRRPSGGPTFQLERDVVVPKIVEIDPDGAVVYDERHRLKLPDWTYADNSSRR